ncbi:MAG: helix-turn-helix domain-containing protein [Alphaproteobacteria bacterium]|nr:helix-turn-helix domain-containing protein [Alphaproteobacteria bacterium]
MARAVAHPARQAGRQGATAAGARTGRAGSRATLRDAEGLRRAPRRPMARPGCRDRRGVREREVSGGIAMGEPLPLPVLMTEGDAAAALGVSIDTMQRLRKRQAIRYRRIGGRIRYTPEDLVDFINASTVERCESETRDFSRSGDIGSASGATARHTTPRGSTKRSAEPVEPPLRLTISKPPKSR